ncbi:SDR family oxidoreductase, partial [Micromonospora tulbaghiae]|uniref:SDR family oxidoreductase n=1 Tax=Micromonospora tulbaghiae TaxID=479978 RepID=UPI0033A6A170
LDVDAFYATHTDGDGVAYGPRFRGLRGAWSAGAELYAEVALPDDGRTDPEPYGLHPALFDACLHVLGLGDATHTDGTDDPDEVTLPFSWSGVRVVRGGCRVVRVRVVPVGEGAVSLTVTDEAGVLVASVGSLVLRAVSVGLLAGVGGVHESLFRVEWERRPGAVPAAGSAGAWSGVPGGVRVVRVGAGGEVSAVGVRAVLADVLGRVQEWLGEGSAAGSRLLVVTEGAVALPGEGVGDLAQAAVWGLVRSAQSENPGRVVLADVVGEVDAAALMRLGLPQVAVREGEVFEPRLVRVPVGEGQGREVSFGTGTVLLTGAGGTLGRLVARRLVTDHGVQRLALVSRRGGAVPGMDAVVAGLKEAGAQKVRVDACDVADRTALAELLERLAQDGENITGVVHAAGVLDDGVISSLTPARLDAVLRPKVDAALNLHELTLGLGLDAFVLFSSGAGVLGSPGQGSYAAANTFLDALAEHRRSQRLPAQSLAWGPWADDAGMASTLDTTDLRRLERAGVHGLAPGEALDVLDAALALDLAAPILVRLDRRAAECGSPAALFHPGSRPT